MSEYDINKHVFRHHCIPEYSEQLDLGLTGRRFGTIRAANLVVDNATLLTLVINSITTGAVTDTGLVQSQVVIAGAGGLLTSSANFTYVSGTALTLAATPLIVSGSGPHVIGASAAISRFAMFYAPTIVLTGSAYGSGWSFQPTLTCPNDQFTAGVDVSPNSISANVGHTSEFANLFLQPPVLTGGGTFSTASLLKLSGTPSGATNNYVIWQTGGVSRFDGGIMMNGGTSGPIATVAGTSLIFGKYASVVPGAFTELMRMTDGGIVCIGTTVTAAASAADLVQAKAAFLRAVDKTGTTTLRLIGSGGGGSADQVFLSVDGQPTRLGDTTAPTAQLEVKSQSAGRTALYLNTSASPTVDTIQVQENGTTTLEFQPQNMTQSSPVVLAAFDTGNGQYGRFVQIGRNSDATNTGAGFLSLQNRAGTFYNIWIDNNGQLRYSTLSPTTANDTAGTAVGTGVSVLNRVTAATTVSNTTVETTIYTFSITGGTLGTTGRFRLVLQLNITASGLGSNATDTFRLKYGATTIATGTLQTAVFDGVSNTASLGTSIGYQLTLLLNELGATNSQNGSMSIAGPAQGGGSINAGLTTVASQATVIGALNMATTARGTGAEDSTVTKNLVVTVQHSVASATVTCVMESAILELC